MSRPSVSIIIPSFNSVQYIPKLAQTIATVKIEAFEIIFVDDGSSDESASLFASLVPNARILTQENSGVAAARNAGAAAARGQFLQFLDADDVILPGKMNAQAGIAVRNGLDVVYSGWQMVIVHTDNFIREPICDDGMSCEPVAALLSGWWVPPHAYLFRREAYEKIGGSDDSLINAQDFDLVLRLAIAGKKFGRLSGHYADYYRYMKVTSLARGPSTQYWSDYERSMQKALDLLERQNGLTPSRRRAAALKLHSIARSVYSIDRMWFKKLVKRVYDIDRDFRPPGSPLYRLVSYVIGLETAEILASKTRRLRHCVAGNDDVDFFR